MAAKDPMYAKLVLPLPEHCGEMAMANDLNGPLETIESHLSSQMYKAMATLNARNETKRAGKKGVVADEN